MTNEEIRKLLGGYATNTLTEAERKVLFEAALDDQDLFNAMQAEEALKDLLSDPISREQVRQALATSSAAKPAAAWWSQRWAWGSAASAVVAAVLIVAVIRWNPSQPRPQEVASVTATKPVDQPAPPTKEAAAASKPEPPRVKALRPARPAVAQGPRKDEADLARALPPTPPPVPPAQTEERERTPSRSNASSEAPRSQDAGHSQNSQNASTNGRDAISNQTPARQEQFQAPPAASALRDSDRRMTTMSRAAPGLAGGFATGPFRVSLMKRDSNGDLVPVPPNPDLKKGDAVQLRVVPVLSGYISLSQLDQSGTWRRVFPPAGLGIPVVANSAYSLPAAPIEVTGKDEKFRVTLSLAAPEAKADVPAELAGARSRGSLKKGKVAPPPPASAPQPSPLFVDLTIGPKNQ